VIDPSARVHATAELEDDVSIGAGTSIWHRAQVRHGARIGRDAVIGRDAFIDENVVLGDRVKVQNGALIYHGVTIEDGVFIGPGVILTNDRKPRALSAAGELARADDWTVSPIRVGSGASIGAGAVVVAGSDVGSYALVGAGSIVTHDVLDHALVVGNPARRIGWVCACAERLVGPDGHPLPAEAVAIGEEVECRGCGRRYGSIDAQGTLKELIASKRETGARA
jgi:acetyltransferase-like isoleucine patch superfamily enzyme